MNRRARRRSTPFAQQNAAGAEARLDAAMEGVATSALEAATTALLPQGFSPAPQVFAFNRFDPRVLVAHVTCRPYNRGPDAALAISAMGYIAAAFAATDLLVFWEEFDVRTSLYGSGDRHPKGLALAQASMTSHYATRFPFDSGIVGVTDDGLPQVQVIHKLPSGPTENAPLVQPISDLMAWWRQSVLDNDFDGPDVLSRARTTGYDCVTTKRAG